MKRKIIYKSKVQIFEKDNKKYIKKIKKSNKQELFNYLDNKGFKNYLPIIEETNEYEIYRYILEKNFPSEDKAIEIVKVLSLLHILTTTYQEINQNKVNELYEKTQNILSELKNYYLELQDYIETKEFFSPAEHLLMNNISNIYKAINYSNYKLEEWYQLIKTKKSQRYVQLHNNVSLNHALKEETLYFINWDNSKKDLAIYDFINFYKNNFQDIEMTSLFKIYQSKFTYTDDELILFESLISIPPKVIFSKNNYIDVINVRQLVNYVEKTNKFLLEDNKENQEENK